MTGVLGVFLLFIDCIICLKMGGPVRGLGKKVANDKTKP